MWRITLSECHMVAIAKGNPPHPIQSLKKSHLFEHVTVMSKAHLHFSCMRYPPELFRQALSVSHCIHTMLCTSNVPSEVYAQTVVPKTSWSDRSWGDHLSFIHQLPMKQKHIIHRHSFVGSHFSEPNICCDLKGLLWLSRSLNSEIRLRHNHSRPRKSQQMLGSDKTDYHKNSTAVRPSHRERPNNNIILVFSHSLHCEKMQDLHVILQRTTYTHTFQYLVQVQELTSKCHPKCMLREWFQMTGDPKIESPVIWNHSSMWQFHRIIPTRDIIWPWMLCHGF